MVELRPAVAEPGGEVAAAVEQHPDGLVPLRLPLADHRGAASRGRLPVDRADVVAGEVRAQRRELAALPVRRGRGRRPPPASAAAGQRRERAQVG